MTLGVVLVLARVALPCLPFAQTTWGILDQNKIVGQWYDVPDRQVTEVMNPRNLSQFSAYPSITLDLGHPRISPRIPMQLHKQLHGPPFLPQVRIRLLLRLPLHCLLDMQEPIDRPTRTIRHGAGSEEAFECHSLLKAVSGEEWGPQSQDNRCECAEMQAHGFDEWGKRCAAKGQGS